MQAREHDSLNVLGLLPGVHGMVTNYHTTFHLVALQLNQTYHETVVLIEQLPCTCTCTLQHCVGFNTEMGQGTPPIPTPKHLPPIKSPVHLNPFWCTG